MRRIFSCFLIILLVSAALPAFAMHTDDASRFDLVYIAGSEIPKPMAYSVASLETLGSENWKPYENTYSLLTSGSILSIGTYRGIVLYDLLLMSGMSPELPDSTPVQTIAKDGYTMFFTLGQIRDTTRGLYRSTSDPTAEATGLPALLAFSLDGLPLVGPTGDQPVTTVFSEKDGVDPAVGNIGGPIRLIIGQTNARDFNAPLCSMWLAAVVVGQANGFVYTRSVFDPLADEPLPEGGDWKHTEDNQDVILTIDGSQASQPITLTLSELEALPSVRTFIAASEGKFAVEGIPLKDLIELALLPSLERPTHVFVTGADGYQMQIDVAQIFDGIDSQYQPGAHREILVAYAIDGQPLSEETFGPLRLTVENTISAWVKGVTRITLGNIE